MSDATLRALQPDDNRRSTRLRPGPARPLPLGPPLLQTRTSSTLAAVPARPRGFCSRTNPVTPRPIGLGRRIAQLAESGAPAKRAGFWKCLGSAQPGRARSAASSAVTAALATGRRHQRAKSEGRTRPNACFLGEQERRARLSSRPPRVSRLRVLPRESASEGHARLRTKAQAGRARRARGNHGRAGADRAPASGGGAVPVVRRFRGFL